MSDRSGPNLVPPSDGRILVDRADVECTLSCRRRILFSKGPSAPECLCAPQARRRNVRLLASGVEHELLHGPPSFINQRRDTLSHLVVEHRELMYD
jgi:hypothetical protein